MSVFSDLPYGPWKEIFSGTWSKYPVRILENPDKQILTMIFDKKEDKIEGVVLIMSNFYYSEQNLEPLFARCEDDSIVLEKKYMGYLTRFFGVSTNPVYVRPELARIAEKVEKLHEDLEYKKEKIYDISKAANIELVDLKNKKEVCDKLFVEPSVFAAMISNIKGEEISIEKPLKDKVFLGYKITKEKVEEPISLFKGVLVFGEPLNREKLNHILMEEVILCGMNAIIWDEDHLYNNIGSANQDAKTENLDPMGMPYKIIKPSEDIFINLNLLNGDMFLESINVFHYNQKNLEDKDKYTPFILKEAIENTSNINSLNDLLDTIETNIKDEKMYFFKQRAKRILKVLSIKYPNLFSGNSNILTYLEKKLVHIGKAIIVDFKNMDLPIYLKRALLYSIYKDAYDFYKNRNNPELQTMLFINKGEKYFGSIIENSYICKKFLYLIDSFKYGFTYCIGGETDVDLKKKLVDISEITFTNVMDRDFAAKFKVKKPYRFKLRIPLSQGP